MGYRKTSTSKLALVMLVILVMASIWPHFAHSRPIHPMGSPKGHLGPLHPVGYGHRMPASIASSNRILESLWFKLSSGPSQGGSGHWWPSLSFFSSFFFFCPPVTHMWCELCFITLCFFFFLSRMVCFITLCRVVLLNFVQTVKRSNEMAFA